MPSSRITTPDALRAHYGAASERSLKKEIPQLDVHMRRFIGLAPFAVLATANRAAELDASPRGGAPGFVKVLDDHTLLVPDSPGNNRLDTLHNIVDHGEAGAPVSLLFMVPGVDETLRVHGRAVLSVEAADLALCTDERRAPRAVVRITVLSCYLHCAKALMRAELWNPAHLQPRSCLPTMGEMLRDQIEAFRGESIAIESQTQMVERYRRDL